MKRQLAIALTSAASFCFFATQGAAQTYPTQPVRIISPFPAGSGPDVVARIVGEKLSATWKQSVIIDPRPGANGFIAVNAVKQAPNTGYDLLMSDVGHMAINTSLFKKLPYDAKADFVPVGGVYRTSFFMAVGANSPYQTGKDLIAAAAQKDGKMTYASSSIGSPLHLGAAQVEAASNTKMLHIPYKELSQMYAAVSTGEVDWAMASIASAGPLLKAGRLRFIAVADSTRAAALPNVPTLEEASGVKGVEARTWVVLMAPKGTPSAVVESINKALNDALKQPDVVEKFANFGFAPYAIAPSTLARLIETDTAKYAEMVKRTGASVD